MPSVIKLLAVAASFASVLEARPSASGYALHEKRDGASSAWIKRDRVHPDAILPMKIGLKQENLHKGYEYLLDVSDPDSTNYGKHWTAEQVHAAFEPLEDTVAAVRQWLVETGIAEHRIIHSENRGWLHFHATAAEAEDLLRTKFHEHEHVSDGKWSVGCDEYHLPEHIREHVDYVTPGVKTSMLKKKTVTKRSSHGGSRGPLQHKPLSDVASSKPHDPQNNLTKCDEIVTPACVAALYQIPEPDKDPAKGNALGIFEQGDTYSQEDLDLFFANFTPYIPKGTHPTLKSVDGGQAPVPVDQAGGESDLDFQLAYPIVYPQEIVLYQVDDSYYAGQQLDVGGYFNTFLDALDGSYCNYSAFGETGNDPKYDPVYPDPRPGGYNKPLQCGVYKPTNVISISYGVQEVDLPANYQQRQCNEWMKLGLQGVSVFVASGDTGVAGIPSANSANNGCLGRSGKIFSPTNPNSCPYLTNVGGTMVRPNGTVFQPESAAYGFFDNGTFLYTSSGGFSNIFPVPDYQKSAVDSYFAKYNPPYPSYSLLGGFNESKAGKGIYNRIGHGIPDVSAVSLDIGVYNMGKYRTFGGTSAAAPIFASIITRINDARLKAGKRPVGFVNPVLYKNPGVLNDITNGTNPGCGTTGFKAVPGWDPVTGLGTPNYPKMLKLFTSLP